MKKNVIRETTLSGFFIAIGIVLPIAFHAIGQGSAFLPMHIPVLLGGFVLSAPYAITVGILTPILSSVLTGMPPVFPVLPSMVFELACYGLMTSLLYRKFKLNIYFSLLGAMISGRLVATAVVFILVNFFLVTLPNPLIWLVAAITNGLFGIALQLVLIPLFVTTLERLKYIKRF